MDQNPPREASKPGGRQLAQKLDKAYNFIQSAPPQAPTPVESESPKLWHRLWQPADQAV
jgi:hypothetical protein